MKSAQMRRAIEALSETGKVFFGPPVLKEIRSLNRSGIRSLYRPLMKAASVSLHEVTKLMRPVFDFQPHGANEKHGAIIRKEVSIFLGIDSERVFLCKILDNAEIRKTKFGSFYAEKLMKGLSEVLKYTVGLKNDLLVFQAQVGGQIFNYIYDISRAAEWKPSQYTILSR